MPLWRLVRGVVLGILGIFWGLIRGIWREASGEADYERNRDQRRALALRCFRTRLHPDEAKRINRDLMRAAPQWAELIRSFQIIADSLDIALKSSNPDTAHSRMDSAERDVRECRMKHGYLLDDSDWQDIERHTASARQAFETAWRANRVTALLAKISTLKTDKSKAKYLAEAHSILEEGMRHSDTDKVTLQGLMSKLPTT